MLTSLVSRKGSGATAQRQGNKGHSPVTLALDVAFIAPDAIHIDGQMADVEMGGNLQLKGTLEAPVVLGNVASTRGTVNILGSSFDLSRARVQFSNPATIDPDIDIVGTTTKGDDEITVRVSGRASKAQLLFSSSSGKSQADVLRELLGSSGAGGANAIASSTARLAAAGVASPILSSVGTATSLHIVPLPTTAEGEEFLFSVGKDLGGGLGVTYYKGLSGETSDAFELRWRISSEGRGRLRQNQDGSLSGGFRIRREFH
jgi:translocation and assembly module TamB